MFYVSSGWNWTDPLQTVIKLQTFAVGILKDDTLNWQSWNWIFYWSENKWEKLIPECLYLRTVDVVNVIGMSDLNGDAIVVDV